MKAAVRSGTTSRIERGRRCSRRKDAVRRRNDSRVCVQGDLKSKQIGRIDGLKRVINEIQQRALIGSDLSLCSHASDMAKIRVSPILASTSAMFEILSSYAAIVIAGARYCTVFTPGNPFLKICGSRYECSIEPAL